MIGAHKNGRDWLDSAAVIVRKVSKLHVTGGMAAIIWQRGSLRHDGVLPGVRPRLQAPEGLCKNT